jgi:pyruvate kinase
MKIDHQKIAELIEFMDSLLHEGEIIKEKFSTLTAQVDQKFAKSVTNFLEYSALRSTDIQEFQQSLSEFGLSSLGRSESHVASNLLAVRQQLTLLLDNAEKNSNDDALSLLTASESKEILNRNTVALLGTLPEDRNVYIMVSLSTEYAYDYTKLKNLIASGMDCARINCAHDSAEVWLLMIDHIKKARKELGVNCKILMDLAGPKIRTGLISKGPSVLKVKPKKDEIGNIVASAKVCLVMKKSDLPGLPAIPVAMQGKGDIQKGDIIKFRDYQEKKRQMKVVEIHDGYIICELSKTAYFETGNKLKHYKNGHLQKLKIGALPAIEKPIQMKIGDVLTIHQDQFVEGQNAKYFGGGSIKRAASIACTLPEVFAYLKAGERIFLDDGKIEGIIETVTYENIQVKIVNALESGSSLGSDKGINFPDSDLKIKGLMPKDLENLHFLAAHAEIVNMSFVNTPEDIHDLMSAIQKLNAGHLGIMLKIETKKGFSNLPLLILTAMQHYPVGIMIARGDLAPEVGWVRLAEIQEEMLWMCEAAHIPVVWATQVLENLAKKGIPSRAEITDAAMGQRAECVMLNKGPFIVEAIQMLRDILTNMKSNQYKKSPILRRLSISDIQNN